MLIEDVRSARAERDAARQERNAMADTINYVGGELINDRPAKECSEMLFKKLPADYLSALDSADQEVETLESERDALAGQVAALRGAVEKYHGHETPKPRTCDVCQILVDTESAARAHDQQVRRDRDEDWCRTLVATLGMEAVERVTAHLNQHFPLLGEAK
jgi:hypothetical protein